MIKIYGMNTCPDCIRIKEQAAGDSRYEVIDIGSHAKYLKEFLRLRDSSHAFDEIKENGTIGIPCFLLENGTVTFSAEEAGLIAPCKYADKAGQTNPTSNSESGQRSEPAERASCSIDGKGC